ncbi:MAG: hypothetical protein QXX41_02755 [Nitrososphaerota archaeon]
MEAKEQEKRGPRVRYTTVSIPVTLYRRIKELIKDSGFTSVSQFVIYILREIAISMEKEKLSENTLSEDEKKQIIEKLRKLGYI